MLYLSLFCLNLSYKSLDVYNSGGGVVPNSDVYKYSDPRIPSMPSHDAANAEEGHGDRQPVSCCSEMDFGENVKESSPLRSLRPFDGLSSPRRERRGAQSGFDSLGRRGVS